MKGILRINYGTLSLIDHTILDLFERLVNYCLINWLLETTEI